MGDPLTTTALISIASGLISANAQAKALKEQENLAKKQEQDRLNAINKLKPEPITASLAIGVQKDTYDNGSVFLNPIKIGA